MQGTGIENAMQGILEGKSTIETEKKHQGFFWADILPLQVLSPSP